MYTFYIMGHIVNVYKFSGTHFIYVCKKTLQFNLHYDESNHHQHYIRIQSSPCTSKKVKLGHEIVGLL